MFFSVYSFSSGMWGLGRLPGILTTSMIGFQPVAGSDHGALSSSAFLTGTVAIPGSDCHCCMTSSRAMYVMAAHVTSWSLELVMMLKVLCWSWVANCLSLGMGPRPKLRSGAVRLRLRTPAPVGMYMPSLPVSMASCDWSGGMVDLSA